MSTTIGDCHIDYDLLEYRDGYEFHENSAGDKIEYQCDQCGGYWFVVFYNSEPYAYTGLRCKCLPAINPEKVCLSRGVKTLGSDVVIDAIHQMGQAYKVPIVSVGCGACAIESMVIKKWGGRKQFRLIDPDPLSFEAILKPEAPFRKIDYPTVDALIAHEPNLVNGCILLLNWCDPNGSEYDYQAIQQLKPLGVLTIYVVDAGRHGAAGGRVFFEWMSGLPGSSEKSGTYLPMPSKRAIHILRPMSYAVMNTTTCEPHQSSRGHLDIRMSWIHYTKCPCPQIKIPDKVIAKIPWFEPIEDECTIM